MGVVIGEYESFIRFLQLTLFRMLGYCNDQGVLNMLVWSGQYAEVMPVTIYTARRGPVFHANTEWAFSYGTDGILLNEVTHTQSLARCTHTHMCIHTHTHTHTHTHIHTQSPSVHTPPLALVPTKGCKTIFNHSPVGPPSQTALEWHCPKNVSRWQSHPASGVRTMVCVAETRHVCPVELSLLCRG